MHSEDVLSLVKVTMVLLPYVVFVVVVVLLSFQRRKRNSDLICTAFSPEGPLFLSFLMVQGRKGSVHT